MFYRRLYLDMEVGPIDGQKIGNLILRLRKEKNMTQKQLADKMHISDKTISKWERGLGCPDISLLRELANILNVNIEQILLGDLEASDENGGNMRNIKFYACEDCGNITTSTGKAEVSCCGRKLSPLIPKETDEDHQLNISTLENDFYITFDHDMTKEHYLSFIAYVTYDRVLLVKLYPEQGNEVRLPGYGAGTFYFGCSKHGLWKIA